MFFPLPSLIFSYEPVPWHVICLFTLLRLWPDRCPLSHPIAYLRKPTFPQLFSSSFSRFKICSGFLLSTLLLVSPLQSVRMLLRLFSIAYPIAYLAQSPLLPMFSLLFLSALSSSLLTPLHLVNPSFHLRLPYTLHAYFPLQRPVSPIACLPSPTLISHIIIISSSTITSTIKISNIILFFSIFTLHLFIVSCYKEIKMADAIFKYE